MLRLAWFLAAIPLVLSAQPAGSSVKNRAVGEALAAEVERNATVIDDPRIEAFLDRLTHSLTAASHVRAPVTVKLISGPNAFAITLPEGAIDLTTNLILRSLSEAELAAVLAHQIAHLELGLHDLPPDSSTLLLFLPGGPGGLCVRTPAHSAAFPIPLERLTPIRQTEAKADQLALTYLQAAGYDYTALIDFYQRELPDAPNGSISRVFDAGALLSQSTRAQTASLRASQPSKVTTSEFVQVQRAVAALQPRPAAVPLETPTLLRKGK